MEYPNIVFISIEGNIGVGKTEYLSILKSRFVDNKKIVFVDEPLDLWLELKNDDETNILENFYQNMTRWAGVFQFNARFSRILKIKEAIEKLPHGGVIISERSTLGDYFVFAQMLYDDKIMSKIEMDIVKMLPHMQLNAIIYINCPSEICIDRIKQRGRKEETDIDKSYIDRR